MNLVQISDEINAHLRAGSVEQAGKMAEDAISGGLVHQDLLLVAGQYRARIGDYPGAATYYVRATEFAPNDADILVNAADMLRYCGRLHEALSFFDRAISSAPEMVAAWFGRAQSFEALGMLTEAELSYERVTRLAPSMPQGFSALANVQILSKKMEAAWENLNSAEKLDPHNYGTLMATARYHSEIGEHLEAAQLLKSVLSFSHCVDQNRILAYKSLGDELEKLGQFDEAFDAFHSANEEFARIHSSHKSEPVALRMLEQINEGVKALGSGKFAASYPGASHGIAGHIFLTGYPRSGTTLTEQILLKIPNTVSLEEARTFAPSEHYLTQNGILAFNKLDNDELAELRNSYWREVSRAGAKAAGKIMIDMDPLKGAALPLIGRMFPDAKIIIVHRDPRDVIWSCFKHSFVFSPATYEFTSLLRAARHYDAMMKLLVSCIPKMTQDIHILRYEELVSDFDQTTQDTFKFLGKAWSPNVRDFSHGSKDRELRTASQFQVMKPLFDGTGRWKGYDSYLKEIEPILMPWIEPSKLLDAANNRNA